METVVQEITPDAVLVRNSGGSFAIPTHQTYLLTGYYADPALLHSVGVDTDSGSLAAHLDPDTFESNVPGLFVIGSAGSGRRTSDVFIENGIVHAGLAVSRISELAEQQQPAAV